MALPCCSVAPVFIRAAARKGSCCGVNTVLAGERSKTASAVALIGTFHRTEDQVSGLPRQTTICR
jgi:hypothetical protein